MKTPKKEKKSNLSDILIEFFDTNTISKLNKNLPIKTQVIRTPNISIRTTDNNSNEIINLFQAESPIDFIITEAEAILSKENFYKLLSKLGNYSIGSGQFASAVYTFEKLATITKGKGKLNKIAADSLLSLGDIFSRQALWGISFNYIYDAYGIFRKLSNDEGCADCENLLGAIHGELGNLSQAYIHFEKALSLLKNKKDSSRKAKIEINLGIINNIQGNFYLALKHFKNALEKFNSVKDLKIIAETKHNLGMLHSKMHLYLKAIKEFDQSINLSLRKGYLPTLGISYLGKAAVYAIQKDYKLSSFFAEKAQEVCHKLNDKLSLAEVYKIKGIIHRDTNNYELAESYLTTSLRINEELHNEMNKAETEFELGLLYKYMDKESKKKSCLINAKKYFIKIGAVKEVKEIDNLLN